MNRLAWISCEYKLTLTFGCIPNTCYRNSWITTPNSWIQCSTFLW